MNHYYQGKMVIFLKFAFDPWFCVVQIIFSVFFVFLINFISILLKILSIRFIHRCIFLPFHYVKSTFVYFLKILLGITHHLLNRLVIFINESLFQDYSNLATMHINFLLPCLSWLILLNLFYFKEINLKSQMSLKWLKNDWFDSETFLHD
jgi:hypothetical protein